MSWFLRVTKARLSVVPLIALFLVTETVGMGTSEIEEVGDVEMQPLRPQGESQRHRPQGEAQRFRQQEMTPEDFGLWPTKECFKRTQFSFSWKKKPEPSADYMARVMEEMRTNDSCLQGDTKEARGRCRDAVEALNEVDSSRRKKNCRYITNGTCGYVGRDQQQRPVYRCVCNPYEPKYKLMGLCERKLVDPLTVYQFHKCFV